MKCGTGINTNPFFEVIHNDLWLDITNNANIQQSITLFDTANLATLGVIPNYGYTIPLADFSVVTPTLVINGVSTNLNSIGLPTTAAALLTRLNLVTTDTWQSYTDAAGLNKVFFTTSATNVYGAMAYVGGTATRAVTNTLGGSKVSVDLVNMNYSQFVSGLPMMKGFMVDTVSIYANTLTQLVQAFFYKRFDTYAGRQVISELDIWCQPFQNQFGIEDLPLCMALDGNNVINYTVAPGESVKIKLRAYANDVAHAIIDQPAVQQEITKGAVGGKKVLFQQLMDGTYREDRTMTPEDTIDEGDYGMG